MSFALDLANFAKKYGDKADVAVRKVVLDFGTALVLKSPVGDGVYWINPPPPGYVGGRFRGNWQYGEGEAPQGELDRIDPAGTETIASFAAALGAHPAGKVHFFTNNVPYAKPLEDGHSRQAPQGVVKLTVLEFDRFVDDAARAANP